MPASARRFRKRHITIINDPSISSGTGRQAFSAHIAAGAAVAGRASTRKAVLLVLCLLRGSSSEVARLEQVLQDRLKQSRNNMHAMELKRKQV